MPRKRKKSLRRKIGEKKGGLTRKLNTRIAKLEKSVTKLKRDLKRSTKKQIEKL